MRARTRGEKAADLYLARRKRSSCMKNKSLLTPVMSSSFVFGLFFVFFFAGIAFAGKATAVNCEENIKDECDNSGGGIIFSGKQNVVPTTTTVSFSPEKWAWLEKRRVNNLSAGEKRRKKSDIIRTIRVALKPDRDSFLTTTRVGVSPSDDDDGGGSGLYYSSATPSSLFPFTLTTPSVMTYVS